MRILLLQGPNLNLLGTREPTVYGILTLDEINSRVVAEGRRLDVEVRPFQSNHEGQLIDTVHAARGWADGVVFNPGAFGHSSYALRDAFASLSVPAIEVHLSNVHAREEFRHRLVIAPVVRGVVCGLGWRGYIHALLLLVDVLREERDAG